MSNSNLLVRLPVEVKEWLRRKAEANCSNMSFEMVRSVQERMDREPMSSQVSGK